MFLKVGHRGAKEYTTENTIAGFTKALELGVNAIEFDVQQTADHKLVVIHDDNLKRVFGHDVSVDATSLKELRALTGNSIPTLHEALEFIDRKVDKILIELKKLGYEKEVVRQVVELGLRDRVIIVSFHEQALAEVRKIDSTIETGLIYARHKRPIAAAIELGSHYLVSLYKITHTKNIEDAHRKNLKVIVWTINSKEEADRFKAKGVDGIASDRPDIL